MKVVITENQRKLIEALNLNLGKELTKYQQKQPVTKELDEIFGKGVYRLYYDLQSGKQIFPTAKSSQTNFKHDVATDNELLNGISAAIKEKGYSIIDFNKNIAKNDRNNQQIKITKILNNYDNDYLKKYNQFLDSITKGLTDNENICIIISRHAYDIAGMSTDRGWSSCEEIDPTILSLKQMDNFHDDDDMGHDGDGSRVGTMIRNGYLIFYTVKNGDWNIQNPISRFAHGVYCNGDAGADFGISIVDGFTNFIQKWVYEWDRRTDKNWKDIDVFFKNSRAGELTTYYIHGEYKNNMSEIEFYRNLFKFNRLDVIDDIFKRGYNIEFKVYEASLLLKTWGKNILSRIGEVAQNEIKSTFDLIIKNINRFLSYDYNKRIRLYNYFYTEMPKMIKNKYDLQTMIYPTSYNEQSNLVISNIEAFRLYYGAGYINDLKKKIDTLNQFIWTGKMFEEYTQYINSLQQNNTQQQVAEKINMKSIKLTEAQFKEYLKDYLNEGLYDNQDKLGAVELQKNTNPNDIKKYTSQGMDVKLVPEKKVVQQDSPLMDEEFGTEQELSLKHKFENDGALNIYASKDKVPLSKLLDYILSIKDQLKVQQALALNQVTFFIKIASSGRYQHIGTITSKQYNSYLNMLKNNKGSQLSQKTELNENLIKLLK